MSNSVVPAAAAVHAKKLVKNGKLTKQNAEQKAAQNEQPSDKDPEEAKAVQAKEGQHVATSMSDVSLSGDFTFASALADAAGTASLVSVSAEDAAQSDGSYGDDDGDGISGTLLLVGAVALVGLGVAVLAGGGNKNDPPAFAAATQAVTTNEDTAKAVTVTATDPDKNETLTYTVTGNPTKGAVTGSNGSYTYTPTANANGSDSFTVTVTDKKGATATQTVNVTITPVNDAPTTAAATQTLATPEDTAVTGQFTATDIDGDALTYSVSTAATKGVATVSATGAISYTPNADANGPDTFVLTASDGKGGTVTQTVTVNVAPVNDTPTAAATQTLSTDEDEAVTGQITAADVDGDTLAYAVSTQGTLGVAAVSSTGEITYTPNDDANGTDTFVLTVSDGAGGTVTQTVTVEIAPVNDAPRADDENTDSLTIAEDTNGQIIIAYTDPEGDDVSASLKTNVANGTLTSNADGSVTYTPNANFNGTDSLVYTVSDGTVSFDKTVTITVTPVNDAPVFADASVTIEMDQDTVATDTATASDIDGDTLTYSVSGAAANGTATVNASGAVTYTPNAGYVGPDSFTLTVSDGKGGTDTLAYAVNVNTTNVAPEFPAASVDIAVDQDGAFAGTLTATDDNDDDLTFALGEQAENGVAVVNADGTYTYTPDDGFFGDDVYTVTVSDGRGGSDTLTVNVTVDPAQIEFSIDIGVPSQAPLLIDDIDTPLSTEDVILVDDAAVDTNVNILGFNEGDFIHVIGADVDDYSFSSPNGTDLAIVFNNTAAGKANIILIEDILDGGFVTDYESAVDAAGFEFMTFG